MAVNGSYRVQFNEGEVVAIVVTMDASISTLVGATLRFRAYTGDGTTGHPFVNSLTYTIGSNLVVNTSTKTATVNIDSAALAAGNYNWELARTNTNAVAVLAWGIIQIKDRPQ